ncbi:FAD-dependent oxidoreductase [Natrarchaeobius halalkaliphilus]|uniref:FAD-dependent oxidoreductase n=1 Tax=Natrarchaeobius halalkaliphilus TaxID=1679091 RepID=A0A3N6MWE4_9EURY|nr:NAD(P)/FAD-dependent oxidoreductase [Natrarchaeobius halalkaliphilus]RQG89802.1 FAD-dependent oxidoreductase [Natrarchaeobius halalkaliphilus]
MTGNRFDVIIVGGGVAGMSTAARLQSKGRSTLVLEQHDHIGGCAGYYRSGEFTFDVGATTLVDFHLDGVGGQLLDEIGFEYSDITIQDAYSVWLPDRTVTLYRDQEKWRRERREKLGNEDRHLEFYKFLDEMSETLWQMTRQDIKMPIQSVQDVIQNVRAVGVTNIPLVRYLQWTMADALRQYDVYDDTPLRKTVAMLVEDTVHSTLDNAPLLNSILGITIRRAGIGRATGGMYGFWGAFTEQYHTLGGTIKTGQTVTDITGTDGAYTVSTQDKQYTARQVVSAVPINLTKSIASSIVGNALDEHIEMLRAHEGGAAVVFLGVPETEVDDHDITHHQILTAYDEPLGDGNNMFVTVSAPEDTVSAPEGYRAVMLSTHCDVEFWQELDDETYARRKDAIGQRLISHARTVYPDLATDPVVYDIGTPVTYESFTNRPRGATGGYRQTIQNSNQHAVPQDIGVDGFYLAGDTTWPGLGTVACIKGSKIAADLVLE